MAENLAQIETRTRLDAPLEISSQQIINDTPSPSLELLAAKINAVEVVVVGPRTAVSDSLTPFEEYDERQIFEGNPPLAISHIDIGEPTMQRRDILRSANPDDINAAEVLSLIAEYDVQLAKGLLVPLARDLLLKRALYTDSSMTVSVRSVDEVKSIVARLNRFSESSLSDSKAAIYKLLARTLQAEQAAFYSEEAAVVQRRASTRLVERVQETRLRRMGLRAVSGLCAVITGGLVYGGVAFGSDSKVDGRLGTIASSEETDFVNYQLLLDQPRVTRRQQTEILDTELLDLGQLHGQITSIRIPSSDQSEQALRSQLVNATNAAEASIRQSHEAEPTDNVAVAELSKIAEKDIPGGGNDTEGKILFDGMAAAYGIFGYIAFRAASKRGGRLDPNIKRYKKGKLAMSDTTSSAAVNSSLGLGQRTKVGTHDESVVVR